MTTASLHCRLLCAANSTYAIKTDGGFVYNTPPFAGYYNQVGYLHTPKVIVGGPDNIDAALVGVNTDGIIVAFRGTLAVPGEELADLLDWLQDFLAEPEAFVNFPGMVHYGFYRAIMSLWSGNSGGS